MEGYLVDCIIRSFIVLNEPRAPYIPDLDSLVLSSASNTGSIWVESHSVDSHAVVFKGIDEGLGSHIPKLNRCVL